MNAASRNDDPDAWVSGGHERFETPVVPVRDGEHLAATGQDGKPINFGDPIPMFCKACGKPWRFDAASARAYVCPCGSSKFEGTVTFRG